MKTSSAIYECEVMHHRLSPKEHHFAYRLFYLWLDLDEVEGLSSRLRLFKHNRAALFGFYDSDHIVRDGQDIRASILQTVRESGVDTGRIAKIRLLTFPRIMGYVFNPVCFYYCYTQDEQPVCAVAEVTNTFHEQKPYVMTALEGGRFRLVTPKHFYVSPFLDLELKFDFKLRLPEEHLEIHVDDRQDGARVILTSLTGKRRSLTDASLAVCALKYPLLTLRVMFLIHWNALLLWMKGLKVHRKAEQKELQRGLYRPHRSLSPAKP